MRACVSAFLILLALPAFAQSRTDGIEHIFGATNINAVTGHGRLAAGISAAGDVTVLSWPNPSFADQLAYLSSNDVFARSLPRFGAPEGAGLFLGLVVDEADGPRRVTWLRDPDLWIVHQGYGPADGANVVTEHVSDALGLTVTVTDAVNPEGVTPESPDVFVRSVDVLRSDGSPVTAAWLLVYANLSPTPPNSRLAELPVIDWVFDGSNDFAALWDASAAAIVHFHPADQLVYRTLQDVIIPPSVSYGAIGELLQAGTVEPEQVQSLASTLDEHYAAGSYVALTTHPAPEQVQIGYDGTPLCAMRDTIGDNILRLPEIFPGTELPLDPALIDFLRCRDATPVHVRQGWAHDATDALEDAADGELQGSGIAAGEVNEALRVALEFSPSGDSGTQAHAAVILGFAPRAAEATAAVAAVSDDRAVVRASEDALDSWLATVHLPDSAADEVRAVARRSLINLRVGTDAATGAIVASISRQPPYSLDWPRDGAFFNVALDVSGQSAVVDRRTALYAQFQRSAAARPTALVDQPPPRDPTTGQAGTYPAAAWEMNYYPDGMTGGPFRFEIDNTGFALWSIVSHVGWVDDAPAYLALHWDAIREAAILLARWRDAETGLQAPASEDDNAAYTQTLHGAVTTYGALDLASRAARLLRHDALAQRWEQRACELRGAVERLLYDAEAERFVSNPGEAFVVERAPTGQTAWMLWPMHVFPWDDARIDAQIAGDVDLIEPRVNLQVEGGSYFMKNTVSFGLARGRDAVLGPKIEAMRDTLATLHPTATRHFGEVMLVEPGDDGPRASQRVATPHLWEGILFYLTAMALEQPDAFDLHEAVLPPSQVPPPGSTCVAAGSCTGDCDRGGEVTVDELLKGVSIALGQAPLDACVAFDPGFDATVTVDDLITAVNHALGGCPSN